MNISSLQNNFNNILIVDDDTRICKLLKQYFTREGYNVSTAGNVIDAENLIKQINFKLIILDVMLPSTTGLEFAKILKSQNKVIPIILLTALGEIEDKLAGFESGADEYLVKPINPKELLYRVNNLIELYDRKFEMQIVNFGENLYNHSNKQFFKKGQLSVISSSEIKLLDLFLDHKGQILSREFIANVLGGVSEQSVNVSVTRLRNKIEEDPKLPKHLLTVRNEGYALYV